MKSLLETPKPDKESIAFTRYADNLADSDKARKLF